MLVRAKLVNTLYKVFYNLRPIILLKKFIKSICVCGMIFRDEITYYPKQVRQLEEEFKSLTSKKFALSFCNGTSSLEAAIYAISDKFDNRKTIIVPSMTFHADLDAVINAGYNIKFVDVSPNSIVPTLSEIASSLDADTACVVLCHLFGHHLETSKIAQYLASKKILFIEDCSHAHCSNEQNDMAKYCDIAFFSLQGAKAIAAGEGGICVTNDESLFVRMSAYSHFGRHDYLFGQELIEFSGTGIGHKHRMAPLGAALALTDIKFLNLQNKIIEINAKKLNRIIGDSRCIAVVDANNGASARFAGLPVVVLNDDEVEHVKDILTEFSISYSNYPFKLHHKIDRYTGNSSLSLRNTEYFAGNGFIINRRYLEYLPFFQEQQFRAAFKKIGRRV